MDIAGVDVEIDVIRELPELEDLEVNSSTEDQSFNSSKYGFKNVIIKGIKGDKLELNPSLEQQNLKGVFTEVNINPIQTKKSNITPTTQEQVITGLFDEIVVNAIEGQELNLNPSEEQQNYEGVFLGVNINPIQVEEITTDLDFSSSDAMELTAQEGVYIKKTTINKPTNLTPENIKSGETVCGIAGINADTSDADATSKDIVAGKTAYVANEKIQGTFVPLDTSDATATAEDIAKDKTAYVNGEKITGTKEATSGSANAVVPTVISKGKSFLDSNTVTTIYMSYVSEYITELLGSFKIDGTSATYAFAGLKNLTYIESIDTSRVVEMDYMFRSDSSLISIPEMDTSNATQLAAMCYGCTNLINFPELNIFRAQNISNMFKDCPNLSDESLNNILAMCSKINNYQKEKTLAKIGLTSEQATKCTTLSNYQAFLDKGWTTGL